MSAFDEPAPPGDALPPLVRAGVPGPEAPEDGVVLGPPERVPDARPLRLTELQQVLRAADPAAVLVPPRALEAVARDPGRLPGLPRHVPPRGGAVVDRHLLFKHVEQEELVLGPEQLLPPTVILLPAPSPDHLDAQGREAILLEYWRRLFHASVQAALAREYAEGKLLAADVRKRVEQIGPAEFAEVRSVLVQEGCLAPAAEDPDAYREFAALYLELRHFAPDLLAVYFPGLGDPVAVDALLAADLDAAALFARTRPRGAPPPGPRAEPTDEESHDYYWKLAHAAGREARAGNAVRAAILRTRAARVAPAELAPGTRREAEGDLRRLAARLRAALHLTPAETAEWSRHLPALLDKADQGSRPVEAALLYDLQQVCLDHEQEIYSLDAMEWLLSAGRRPVKRPLPGQRVVRVVEDLRSAAARLPRTRLSGADRQHLARLFDAALAGAERRLRERFRPLLADALLDVGLRPANPPERVASDKLVDELLDRIATHGFLTFGDLRDAISRNQLKLPDLADPQQFVRGDPLLRLDRRLAILLDGVYRPSELYVRWLQRLTSLNFGTAAGRFLTRWVTVPFGSALVLAEGVDMVWKHFGPSPGRTVNLLIFLCTGLFLLGLLHLPGLRRGCARAARLAGRALGALFVELPARVMANESLRRLLRSWPCQLFYWYLFKPLLVCFLIWWWVPEAFETVVGAAGIFLAIGFLLNSRPGAAAWDAASDGVDRLYQALRGGLIPGLVRLIVRVFKWALDLMETVFARVDEWLRFRSGAGWPSLAVRTVLGLLWFPVAYVARLYAVVLIEPMLNPLKFPICSVAAKFIYPITLDSLDTIRFLDGLLAPLTGPAVASAFVWLTLFLLPDAFGFLFWEMKENWRLYRANRSPSLRPVAVGPHGETIRQLLQPGFHSGTVPRLYARLREVASSPPPAGGWEAVSACRQSLEEVERSVRLFVTRETVFLLGQAGGWQGSGLSVGAVALSTNRIRVELRHADFAPEPAWLEFEQQAGWLVAGIPEPGWLQAVPPPRRPALTAALVGLYRLAGVDLVREQFQAQLPPGVRYEFVPEGVRAWRADDPDHAVVYDLRDRAGSVEAWAAGARAAGWPALDTRRLLFARLPLSWTGWVESWEKDQEGNGHPGLLPEDPGLVPAG